jgi:hypothetical protein
MLKPKFNCEYQETNVFGICYCRETKLIECPYLSESKMNQDVYSAVSGRENLEFRACDFKGEMK